MHRGAAHRHHQHAVLFAQNLVVDVDANHGVGTQFATGDINNDGLLDIALSNKKGVNILLQRREKTVAGK